MTGPITPHITIQAHVDGVKIAVMGHGIVVPAEMARSIGQRLIDLADVHDPLGMTPLPIVVPQKDRLK